MAVMGKKVWAVICGKIRQEFEFYTIISWLCEQRSKGLIEGIVFSTWVGEIDEHSGLRAKINELGIYVAESPEITGSGSMAGGVNGYFLQAMQIEAGLKMIPNDVFVIKCRTDFCMHILGKILYLLENNVDLSTGEYGCYRSEFKYRIAVNVFSIGAPFCFDDLCYLAYRQDLEKLIIFENTLYKYNEISDANYLFFMNGFKNRFSIINEFLCLFKYYKLSSLFFNEINSFKSDDFQLPNILNKFYALYLVILFSDFYLLGSHNNGRINASIDIMDLFRCNSEIGMQRTWITRINNQNTIDKIIMGDITANAGTKKLYNEIVKVASPNYAEFQDITRDDYNEVVEFGKKFFNLKAQDWLKPFNMIGEPKKNTKDFSEVIKTLYSEKASTKLIDIMRSISLKKQLWDYYRGITDYLDIIRELDSEVYESALLSACRSLNPRLLKKAAVMLYENSMLKENISAAEYYFTRYNDYNFPMVGDKLAAYYYFGRYSESKENTDVPKKFFHSLLRQFDLRDNSASQSYADGALTLIKEIVNERYAEYRQNLSIRYMIDFLEDEFPDDSFSDDAKSYLSDYLINRRYNLPFMQGDSRAFEKLIEGARKACSEAESETILKLMLREKANCSPEMRPAADEAVHNLIEHGSVKRSCFTDAYLTNENETVIIAPAEIKNNDDFILLLRILATGKCLKANIVQIKNLCGDDNCRLAALELFLRIESDSRIHFFSMKNGVEMWINYSDFLNSKFNKELLLLKNNDGMAWPQSDTGSASAFAALIRRRNNDIFISIEFSSGNCAAKDMLFEKLDKSTLNDFDSRANLIRLKTSIYPFASSDEIGSAVNRALDEFCRIGALLTECAGIN